MGDRELEQFKAEIDLVELASSYGYECVEKESSRLSVKMVHPDGDKIVVATAPDGHSIFFSVRENEWNGSVIDFVMSRERVHLGGARQVLRRCLASGGCSQRVVHYRPEIASHNGSCLYEQWLHMEAYPGNGYLERRGLSASTIAAFSDRIRRDRYGNVIFRHDDLHNVTGWEMKNRGFTGFSGGGKKALFGCKVGMPDKCPLVVLTESAIDALSYYQLQPRPGFYLSFAGTISNNQQLLLTWVLNRYPGARIIVATDNDTQGERYAGQLRSIRGDAERDCPPVGKDWNDSLMNREARNG